MSFKNLKICSYFYLILPIIIFMAGWLKLSFAIIPIIFLVMILLKKFLEKEEDVIVTKKRNIVMIFLIVLCICILGGIGGFFYQSTDWHCRNAIFRDLINFRWPVYYKEIDSALTYYIAFWMVPAMIRKMCFISFWRSNCLECR